MKLSPKSFVLDLLSTLKHGTMPVGALVEAGELFGIPGNTLRVALARLLAAGQVGRDERGRYRLAEGAAPVAKHVTSWRDLERRTRAWDGGWIAVHASAANPKVSRAARRGRTRALQMLGFAPLRPHLALRPDNLRAGVSETRRDLHALGLPAEDLVFELRELAEDEDRSARDLWDTDGLRATYRKLGNDLADSAGHLAGLPAREAMIESFLVGGRAVRELILDPLLPDEICPTDERAALLCSMKDYDRLGRAAWAEFLGSYDVPHRRGPIDSRLAVTANLEIGPGLELRGTDRQERMG